MIENIAQTSAILLVATAILPILPMFLRGDLEPPYWAMATIMVSILASAAVFIVSALIIVWM